MALEYFSSSLYGPLADAAAPSSAVVWTSKQYCTMTGWNGLENADDIQFRPTKFADKRFRFLQLLSATTPPKEFANAVSGQYDIKTWRKDDCVLSLDGGKAVYLKFPNINQIVTYTSPERLPTFSKSWQPIVFVLNENVITVRLTQETALLVTRNSASESSFNVVAVKYNQGFICVHPCTNLVLCYGSYSITSLKNCLTIPSLGSAAGPWNYIIQFFEWGTLILCKNIKIYKQNLVKGLCGGGGKSGHFGLLYCAPNMFLHLTLVTPMGISRSLKHGENFAATAKKISESDITIYLLLDGQLAVYEYSFDMRLNKPNLPGVHVPIKFKVVTEKKKDGAKKDGDPEWIFAENKTVKVPVKEGCPTTDFDYLVNNEVVAMYDAEIGQYLTHPQGAKLSSAFREVLAKEPKETFNNDNCCKDNGDDVAGAT